MCGKQKPATMIDLPFTRFEGLFPDYVVDCPEIIFHGTSQSNAEKIELNGICGKENSSTLAEAVNQVVGLYDAINWAGTDNGGYGVLKGFSQGFDLGGGTGTGLTFFSPDLTYAMRYATDDFAGGEKARALRKAIADLHKFIDSPDEMEADRAIHFNNPVTGPPPPVDLAFLSYELARLKALEKRVNAPLLQFTEGIVYAILLMEDDLSHFGYSHAMGAFTNWTVPPDRIVASVTVPRGFEVPQRKALQSLTKATTGVAGRMKRV